MEEFWFACLAIRNWKLADENSTNLENAVLTKVKRAFSWLECQFGYNPHVTGAFK